MSTLSEKDREPCTIAHTAKHRDFLTIKQIKKMNLEEAKDIEAKKDMYSCFQEIPEHLHTEYIERAAETYAQSKLKNNGGLADVSDFTLEEMQNAVAYGFWYATESQNNGGVPIRNFLQWVFNQREMIKIPKEWDDFMKANGYER